MNNDQIEIVVGMPEQHRETAATIYYAAFEQKLGPIFRDTAKAQTVLAASLDNRFAISAIHNEQLVGIAGFKTNEGHLVAIEPHHMTAAFGWLGGWTRILGLALFLRKLEPGTLLMDGLVVAADMRGKGIGSQLLEATVNYAREHGYARVRLDVVDTNPRAQQLYERKGFIATNSSSYPWLTRQFGFERMTTMIRQV